MHDGPAKISFRGPWALIYFEEWLQFIACKGELGRFHHRLRTSTKEQRDETFAEIGCAYFLEKNSCFPIIGWEPPGIAGKKGEFLVVLPDGRQMFVEVKSPGWEAEITRSEPASTAAARLAEPKYPGVEAFFTSAEPAIVQAIKKAYGKLPDTIPTLLLIFDDERVPLTEMYLDDVLGALYEKHIPGARTPPTRRKTKKTARSLMVVSSGSAPWGFSITATGKLQATYASPCSVIRTLSTP